MRRLLLILLLLLPVGAQTPADATGRLGLDLLERAEPGNAVLSPFSLSTALSMTYLGARGATAEQMARVLHLSPATAAQLGRLQTRLAGKLDLANRIWPHSGRSFSPAYLDLLRQGFGSDIEPLDYQADPEQARATINAWVSGKTRKMIPELLGPGILTPLTRLVLTNAVYFKGAWQHPFDPAQTKDEPFYGPVTRPVKMMAQVRKLRYLEEDGLQVLELPYKDSTLIMWIVLPRDPKSLPRLEAKDLARWREELAADEVSVHVSLPRFKVSSNLVLARVLSAMGMPLAFTEGKADFSGMDGTRDLYLTAVIHQAVVEVNEVGTEAAAATAAVLGIRSSPVRFRADHPFLFVLLDRETGVVLFLGRVVQP